MLELAHDGSGCLNVVVEKGNVIPFDTIALAKGVEAALRAAVFSGNLLSCLDEQNLLAFKLQG
jgi:hypothetical protein